MDDLKPEEKPKLGYRLKRFRDVHHMIARLVALGMDRRTIAAKVGRGPHTITNLLRDPAFQNIVGLYRAEVDQAFRDEAEGFFELCSRNALIAERMINEKLEAAEDEGEIPSIRELLSISRDGADRIGYGKRTTQVNVNVDFAAQLERAIQRSKRGQPEGKVIEHSEAEGPTRKATPNAPLPEALAPIRRRLV